MNKYKDVINMYTKERRSNDEADVVYVQSGETFNGYTYDEIIKMHKEFSCKIPTMIKSKYCNLDINKSVEKIKNFGTSINNQSSKSEESFEDKHIIKIDI